jgi:hypothetical protein
MESFYEVKWHMGGLESFGCGWQSDRFAKMNQALDFIASNAGGRHGELGPVRPMRLFQCVELRINAARAAPKASPLNMASPDRTQRHSRLTGCSIALLRLIATENRGNPGRS